MAKSKVTWHRIPLNQCIKYCKKQKLPIRYVRSKDSSGLMYPEVLCSEEAYSKLLAECK